MKLTFDGIPERLVVPFAAIKVFFDPSVRFGLQFEDPNAASDGRSPAQTFDSMTARGGTPRPGQTRKVSRTARKPRAVPDDVPQAPHEAGGDGSAPSEGAPIPAVKPQGPTPVVAINAADGEGEKRDEAGSEPETARPSGGAEIVSLDKFRKK